MIIEHNLPQNEMALYGLLCPLCGKTDRIRELEPPDDIVYIVGEEDIEIYKNAWNKCLDESRVLGVCKFCNTPLSLDMEEMKAEFLG